MHQYQIKNQSDALFQHQKLPQKIFQQGQNPPKSFSLIDQTQNSKFKIPKLNNLQAKSIFLSLSHKNSSKNSSLKKNWKLQQTSLLVYLVEKFSFTQEIQNITKFDTLLWDQISQYLPGRPAQDCKYKILSLTASTITNIPWSTEERNVLTDIIEEEGMKWNLISQQLYEKSDAKIFRTSKQCREHYMCFLKPNLKKGAWTEQQDFKLVSLFLEYGRKWSKIMKFIEGRNQNSIKNRFFLLFQNKGKTSNQSDLLRKVKRKKQRMEKTLKEVALNFKFQIEQKDGQKLGQKQLNGYLKVVKLTIDQKGEELQLSEYLLKYEQKQQVSRKDLEQYPHSRNRLSLNNFQSYQQLDFSQLQIGQKSQESIDPFQSFQQYICF